jgi:hypothetical protein
MADDDEPAMIPPDSEATLSLPPATFPDPVDDDEDAEPPPPPPVEGTTELSTLSTYDADVSSDPVLRSPWSPVPATSFSTTPLAADTTGPLPAVQDYPAASPAPTVAVLPPLQTEQVTCPECGTVAMVTLTRREAADFCRNCDYPLFWTPSIIMLDRSGLSDDSLRRLPGTVGRVAVAHLTCPHCAEPNQLTAVDCIRCGRPLRPVHYEPPPLPTYVAPPPEPEPEPERGIPWWVWVSIALMVITVTLVLLYAYDAWPFD